jgi:tRNA(fMet)-specific endonuclease VapC
MGGPIHRTRSWPSYAEIRLELKAAGRPIPTNDVWIAALARQYGLVAVLRGSHSPAFSGFNTAT